MIKKKYVIGLGICVMVGLGVALSLLLTGPHMENQGYLRTYEKSEMLPPPNSVPIEKPPALPAADEKNPLQNTPENFSRGKVYYIYYCVFCHGDNLNGNGPVGESYIPRPSDLKQDSIKNKPDAELVKEMLTGIGHTPVLERVVPGKYWWYLSLFVKNYKDTTAEQEAHDIKHSSSNLKNRSQMLIKY